MSQDRRTPDGRTTCASTRRSLAAGHTASRLEPRPLPASDSPAAACGTEARAHRALGRWGMRRNTRQPRGCGRRCERVGSARRGCRAAGRRVTVVVPCHCASPARAAGKPASDSGTHPFDRRRVGPRRRRGRRRQGSCPREQCVGGRAAPPETAGFVEGRRSPPALPLLVPSERLAGTAGDARIRGRAGAESRS
jgi:hypothetical protein